MQEATRELYWNISGQWIMYILFAAVVTCFAIFFYRRYRLWKLGAPEDLSDNKKVRFFGAFKEVFTQKRVVKKKSSGIMHLFIFWGMLFLFVATALTTLQDHFGIPILYGPFYLYFFSLGIDLAGFVCAIGIVIALVRRIARTNEHLETNTVDIVWLVLLLLILVSPLKGCASWVRTTRGRSGRQWGICSRSCSRAWMRKRFRLRIRSCGGAIWCSHFRSWRCSPKARWRTCSSSRVTITIGRSNRPARSSRSILRTKSSRPWACACSRNTRGRTCSMRRRASSAVVARRIALRI